MPSNYNFRAASSFSSLPSSFPAVVAATVVAAAVVAAAVVGAAVVAAAVVGAAVVGAGVVVGFAAAIATGAVAMPGIMTEAPPLAGIVAMPVAGIMPDASGTWLAWAPCSARLAGAIDRCWAGSVLLSHIKSSTIWEMMQ